MRVDYSDILYQRKDGIATVTINRPAKHNALRLATFRELIDALEEAAKDESVGVVVLTGSGAKAFCAGGDLGMARDELRTLHDMRTHHIERMLRISALITQMDKPVLCAVNGLCVGAGVEIACFCDLVIAADHASFYFNGTRIGGCLWWGPPQLLPLMVGLKKAQEILLFGKPVEAGEAQRIGLVNKVVSHGELGQEVEHWCQELLDCSPAGLAATKASLRANLDLLLAPLNSVAELNACVEVGPQAQVAFAGFLSKQPVSWRSFRPKATTTRGITKE
jgi:enoyl-CoA hydratase/carnithine racemase